LFITSKKAENFYLKPIFVNNEIKSIFDFKSTNYKKEIQTLSEDLSNYLYFKTILEKILIYVRYHLKTLKTEND
jgi:hypothetical protein